MYAFNRRTFLGFLSACSAWGRTLWGRAQGPAESEFPFRDRVKPYPPGKVKFPKGLQPPSRLHPNGKWVVLPNPDGGISTWDWTTGRPVKSFKGTAEVDHRPEACGHSYFTPGCFLHQGKGWLHGRLISQSGESEIRYWVICLQDPPTEIQVRPQDGIDSTGDQIHTLVEDTTSRGQLAVRHTSWLTGALRQERIDLPGKSQATWVPHVFSGDGRFLALEHSERQATWWSVWSLPDMTCRAFKRGRAISPGVNFPQFSLDGARLHLPDGPWDWAGVEPQAKEPLHSMPTEQLPPDISARGGQVVLKQRRAGILEAVEVTTGKLLQRLVAFPPSVNLVAFGHPRNLVIACAPMDVPWVWNRTAPPTKLPAMLEGELSAPAYSQLRLSTSRSVAWSGNGKWIAVGTLAGEVHLYESEAIPEPTGPPSEKAERILPKRRLMGLKATVRGIAFFKGGIVALDEHGRAAAWSLDSAEPRAVWQAHPDRGNTIQVAKDGSWALTGGLDGISLWSLPDCKRLHRFGGGHFGVACIHLEPGQGWVAGTFLDGSVAIYDLPSGRERWRVASTPEVATAVAIHPSGDWLVTGSWRDELVAWDAKTGVERKRVKGSALALAWSQDGHRLAAGSTNGATIYTEELVSPEDPAYHLEYGWNEECT